MSLNINLLEHQNKDDVQQLFFTPKQVATIFGVSLSTVYQKVQDGIFPKPTSIGGSISRFSRDDIEKLIADMKAGRLAVKKS